MPRKCPRLPTGKRRDRDATNAAISPAADPANDHAVTLPSLLPPTERAATHQLAPLELLPAEILQDIYLRSGNFNLEHASVHLRNIVGSNHIRRKLLLEFFLGKWLTWPVSRMENYPNRFQEIIEQSWFDVEMVPRRVFSSWARRVATIDMIYNWGKWTQAKGNLFVLLVKRFSCYRWDHLSKYSRADWAYAALGRGLATGCAPLVALLTGVPWSSSNSLAELFKLTGVRLVDYQDEESAYKHGLKTRWKTMPAVFDSRCSARVPLKWDFITSKMVIYREFPRLLEGTIRAFLEIHLHADVSMNDFQCQCDTIRYFAKRTVKKRWFVRFQHLMKSHCELWAKCIDINGMSFDAASKPSLKWVFDYPNPKRFESDHSPFLGRNIRKLGAVAADMLV